MFELLLQADRALADGALDQAERTYWQLVELDPTNAIAVAGLARVWLERGDERSARTFADRALSIDPDSIAARRVLEAIDHEGPERPVQEQPELPLLAAERLEALSRRHGRDVEAEGEGMSVGARKTGRGRTAAAKATAAPAAATEPPRSPAPNKPATAVDHGAESGGSPAQKESRGRTRPDLPSEPLRERRQAGRLAAAAAAAAAAAREPLRPRHEPHHAMPIGLHHFARADLKAQPVDAFSAAEMAAAVEAVGAMDENGGAELEGSAAAAPTGDRRADGQSDLMNAVDATAADDSVALRIALVADAVELDAAEQSAARVAGASSAYEASAYEASAYEASEDSFEAAEAMAEAVNFLPLESGSGEPAGPPALALGVAPGPIEPADADAAEAAAVAEAMREVSDTDDGREVEPASRRGQFRPVVAEEPSEEEAEAQALREAMAIVLEADGRAPGAEAMPSPDEFGEPAESSEPVESAGHSEAASPREPAASSEPPESQDGSDSSTRKHGLFHRKRGS
jgi:tetratricopeptide (TPR) repeat protein